MGAQKRKEPTLAACPHIEALSKQKQQRILESVWDNAKRTTGSEHVLDDGDFHCITCGMAACTPADHKHSHRKKKLATGHELLLHLPCNEIYCTACGDYVYCQSVDRDVSSLLASRRCPSNGNASDGAAETSPIEGTEPTTSPEDVPTAGGSGSLKHLKELPRNAPLVEIPLLSTHPRGLRGLNNMGHTCFMNAILQALLHSPLLPEHHLAHGHARQSCSITADSGYCVGCELDGVFSAAYSGINSPHSPAAFLHAWWMLAGGALSGYKQQDAHEFFLFILEMLAATTGQDNVVSKLFTGAMQSDVVCSACGATSTTEDAFTNLSLDVPAPTCLLPHPIIPRPNANAINGKAGAAAAKASKNLVGAARAAHLARLSRQRTEQTPERSSELLDPALDDSMSCEMNSAATNSALGGDAAVLGRPSPPVTDLEQGSGVDAGGATITNTDDAARDTLSSPRRRAAGLGPGKNSSSPSSEGGLSQQPLDGATPALASDLPHPSLAGFSRWPGASLLGCLKRFVWPEELGASERWCCPKCLAQDGAVKQMSLSHLPPVLVLHAKRFEHAGGTRATAKKLDTYLSFPLEGLDMGPYTTSNALRSRHDTRSQPPLPQHLQEEEEEALTKQQQRKTGNNSSAPGTTRGTAAAEAAQGEASVARRTRSSGALSGTPACAVRSPMTRSASAAAAVDVDLPDHAPSMLPSTPAASPSPGMTLLPRTDRSALLYDLFAVVCHRGNFQGGHYVAYVRCENGQWYLCDDAYVSPVSADVVRDCQAYMLFYGQQKLMPWCERQDGDSRQ